MVNLFYDSRKGLKSLSQRLRRPKPQNLFDLTAMDDILWDAYKGEDFKEILELLNECDSDSDDERRGGSRPGRSANIEQNRAKGAKRLFNDYFCADPTCPPRIFERRFRVSLCMFVEICEKLKNRLSYFQQRKDATG